MDLNKYVSGKMPLNEYVHRIVHQGASFHVHYWGAMPEHYDNLLHKHSFFEVCYVVDGEGTYIDNDCSYSLYKNVLFLSRPEVIHQIKSETGLFLLYVGFELVESESNDDWIRIMEEAKQCSEIWREVAEENTTTLLWKSLMVQATKKEHAYFEPLLTNIAFSLILSILQTFSLYSNVENNNTPLEQISPILNQATLHIRDNLSDSLKLTDVAKHVHISGRHLSRLFVSELGTSYSEFVQNERIQRAAILLKTTDKPIKIIAEETGFTNVQYFTRVFTSSLRTPPGVFRSLYTDLKTISYRDS